MDCEGREEVADHRVVPSLFPSFMRPLKRGVRGWPCGCYRNCNCRIGSPHRFRGPAPAEELSSIGGSIPNLRLKSREPRFVLLLYCSLPGPVFLANCALRAGLSSLGEYTSRGLDPDLSSSKLGARWGLLGLGLPFCWAEDAGARFDAKVTRFDVRSRR